MKERITLLLGTNASGDMKLKPLLINNSATPRAFSTQKIVKEDLPVIWKHNKKAWMTQILFQEWVCEEFAPAVKTYLLEKGHHESELKALLLLDNAPGHPPACDMENAVKQNVGLDLKVVYMPPNTTSLIQPMDQNIIANFKALYMRDFFALFRTCCPFANQDTLRLFWKETFKITHAIQIIDTAWNAVTTNSLIAGWRNLIIKDNSGK